MRLLGAREKSGCGKSVQSHHTATENALDVHDSARSDGRPTKPEKGKTRSCLRDGD